jgi:hypothetical protein
VNLINEWNRAAMMRASTAMTLVENLKVKNQIVSSCWPSLQTCLGRNIFYMLTSPMYSLQLLQIVLELPSQGGGSTSSTSNIDESQRVTMYQ